MGEGVSVKTGKNLMTEGNIWRKIIFFSIPMILGNLLQQMYNAVDSVIVGNYVGSNALAAVGSSTSIINLLIAFSMGASAGAGVVVSQFIGAGNKKGVKISVHTALAIAIILGMILTAAGIIFTPTILKWMRTPEEVMRESVVYLRLYSAGLLFSVVYNMAAGILNAVGDSKRPLIYLGSASFLNIVLDIILINWMKMGIAGAAIATNISQILSCILILVFLSKVPENYQLKFREIKIYKKMAGRIIKIGLPTAIQNTVISFSNILVQSSVNTFGAKAMAGFGAYLKLDGFNILPILSFSMAVTTFTGQNYGAGKTDRLKKGMWAVVIMGVVYTLALGAIILMFSDFFMGIFTQDKEVMYYGIKAMKYFCPFYFLLSIMHGLGGTIRGTGKTVPPMVILLISLCLFRIVWIQFIVPKFNTIDIIYLLYPVSWFVGMVLMILYAWKGSWRKGIF